MQFTIGIGVNNNHFEYWSQYLSRYLFYTKNCNEINVGGGGRVLSFLDEG
jgi:hypothetical protein